MKKEIKYIELEYTFDCDTDYEYREYDGIEFVYKIDEEDAKYAIAKSEIKKLELDVNPFDLIEIFDDMLLWDTLINDDTIEWLKGENRYEAMEWFKEEHLIIDYEENEADAYNDERWCD